MIRQSHLLLPGVVDGLISSIVYYYYVYVDLYVQEVYEQNTDISNAKINFKLKVLK